MTIYSKDYVKDPAAVKDYTIDWTAWLDGDTISGSSWAIPTGIVKDSATVNGPTTGTIIWISGGTLGEDYECVNTIVTAGGRTELAMLKIQVR